MNRTSIKATEIISSYLRAPVQGWNDHESRKTTGAFSDTLRRDRDERKAIIQVLLKISAQRSKGHTTAAAWRSASRMITIAETQQPRRPGSSVRGAAARPVCRPVCGRRAAACAVLGQRRRPGGAGRRRRRRWQNLICFILPVPSRRSVLEGTPVVFLLL